MANAKIDDNHKPSMIGVSSADGDTPLRAEINPVTRRLLVDSGNLVAGYDYDYLDVQQTSSTVETYVYKLGGSGGTTVQTVTTTYTDSSKATVGHVEWS